MLLAPGMGLLAQNQRAGRCGGQWVCSATVDGFAVFRVCDDPRAMGLFRQAQRKSWSGRRRSGSLCDERERALDWAAVRFSKILRMGARSGGPIRTTRFATSRGRIIAQRCNTFRRAGWEVVESKMKI